MHVYIRRNQFSLKLCLASCVRVYGDGLCMKISVLYHDVSFPFGHLFEVVLEQVELVLLSETVRKQKIMSNKWYRTEVTTTTYITAVLYRMVCIFNRFIAPAVRIGQLRPQQL